MWFVTAGTAKGLWRWTVGSPKFYSLDDPRDGLEVLTADGDGALLLLTNRGLSRFAAGKTATVLSPRTESAIESRALLRDRDGGVWIGTRRGLLHVQPGLPGRDAGRGRVVHEGELRAHGRDAAARLPGGPRERRGALLSTVQAQLQGRRPGVLGDLTRSSVQVPCWVVTYVLPSSLA